MRDSLQGQKVIKRSPCRPSQDIFLPEESSVYSSTSDQVHLSYRDYLDHEDIQLQSPTQEEDYISDTNTVVIQL